MTPDRSPHHRRVRPAEDCARRSRAASRRVGVSSHLGHHAARALGAHLRARVAHRGSWRALPGASLGCLCEFPVLTERSVRNRLRKRGGPRPFEDAGFNDAAKARFRHAACPPFPTARFDRTTATASEASATSALPTGAPMQSQPARQNMPAHRKPVAVVTGSGVGMARGGGARAWELLKRNPEYAAAWLHLADYLAQL